MKRFKGKWLNQEENFNAEVKKFSIFKNIELIFKITFVQKINICRQ